MHCSDTFAPPPISTCRLGPSSMIIPSTAPYIMNDLTPRSPRGLTRATSIPSLVLRTIADRSTQLSSIELPRKSNTTPNLRIPPWQRQSHAIYPLSPTSPQTAGGFSPLSLTDEATSSASSFTITLMDSPTAQDKFSFSFTASPTSPPLDSIVYAFPPKTRERPVSVQTMPLPSRRSSMDDGILTLNQFGPIIVSDEMGEDGLTSDSDDWRQFHVHFLQEEAPFPETPAC